MCLALDSALSAEEISRWDPRTMSAGDSLAGQLRHAIDVCDVCVSIATRRSTESPWCQAELGAFWGAGKRVLLYIADPDLTDAILPPQFKGDLKVSNAQDLIKAIKDCAKEQVLSSPEFFRNSTIFGDEKWQALLYTPTRRFWLVGVALHSWTKMKDFQRVVRDMATKTDADIRFLILHPDNPSIEAIGSLSSTAESANNVRGQIDITSQIFEQLSELKNVQFKQLLTKTPNFALTLTDTEAVLSQYLHSVSWGSGPLFSCKNASPLYSILEGEFAALWDQAEMPSSQPTTGA